MLNEALANKMRELFPGDDGDTIADFLARDFSNNGQVAVASIFLRARDAGKNVSDVLPILEREYKEDWQYMHPDVRGDVDAPGGYGVRNQNIVIKTHRELDIPMPG